MAATKVLTAQAVAKMKPSAGSLPREVPDGLTLGLYLVIYPSGKKSWALRFRRPDNRPAKLVLGTVNLLRDEGRDANPVIGGHLTLAAARRLAALLRDQIAAGRDPAAIHKAKQQAIQLSAADTFASAARDFIEQYAKKKTKGWREQAKMLGLAEDEKSDLVLIDKGLAARWRDKPVAEIDADAVFRLIEEVRHRGVPGLARRNEDASEPRARLMHAALSKLFGWLVEKRRIKTNPVTGLKRPAQSEARDRVLTNREIIAFWQAATDLGSSPFNPMLKLLLLTGCRLREAAQMEIRELSDDGSTWTIPGRRTKNKRAHVVALAPLAREIIAGVERLPECQFVFTTNQKTPVSGFSKIKKRLDAAMTDVPAWRLHDLRRTCATGMAEIGIAPHIVEVCLNHVSGFRGGIAGVYNRALHMEERREALELWANHVTGLVGAP
jgi:integrase